MSAFHKVIGYEAIKRELMQLADMFNNSEIYEKLGAKPSRGVLIYGEPGVGKTLLANCFIEESGVNSFTIRKTNSEGFLDNITSTFQKAKEMAPSIVLLDDLDKFANEDCNHKDAEEYVAVQAAIDDVKNAEVMVLATANDIKKLPKSLLRAGRFDRSVEVNLPTSNEAERIVAHYLEGKPLDDNVNLDDFIKMIEYQSCAELETILNEAAIVAAFERHSAIEMNDLVETVLRQCFAFPDGDNRIDDKEFENRVIHEAGHLTVCEALHPGSAGFVVVKATKHDVGGFVHMYKDENRRPERVLISLAGKAAVEQYNAETVASGCSGDLNSAREYIYGGLCNSATRGFAFLESKRLGPDQNALNAVINAELERYMLKTRDILLKNHDFLEKTIKLLREKKVLLYSDIRKIRESCEMVSPELVV